MKEGILGGSSTGTLLAAALKYCREQTTPKKVLVFVCDTGNKYLSKMYNDYWMLDNGFLEREQYGDLRDLILRPYAQRDTVVVGPNDLLVTAYQRMKLYDVSQLPVMDGDRIVGIVDESDVLLHVYGDEARFRDPVSTAMVSKLDVLDVDSPIESLLPVFDRGHVAIVIDGPAFPRPDHPHRPAQLPAPARAVSRPSEADGRIADWIRSRHERTPRRSLRDARLGTLAIHGGQSPDPSTGAVMAPIYATCTYAQSSPGVHQGFEYSRSHNPTRFAYERCVAALEGGTQRLSPSPPAWPRPRPCWTCSTAAATSSHGRCLRRHLPPVRARAPAQRGAGFQLRRPDRPGRVRSRDPAEHEAGLDRNPDQSAAEDRRHRARSPRSPASAACWLAVDNTFSSPILQRPLELGARPRHAFGDQVPQRPFRHGRRHDRGRRQRRSSPNSWPSCRTPIGAVQGPFDSFLALRGLKTLHLRMQAHCDNAHGSWPQWLETHPAIEKVIYPGLASHPQHALASTPDGRLRRHVSIWLKGGFDAARSASASAPNCSPAPNRSAASKAWSTIRR